MSWLSKIIGWSVVFAVHSCNQPSFGDPSAIPGAPGSCPVCLRPLPFPERPWPPLEDFFFSFCSLDFSNFHCVYMSEEESVETQTWMYTQDVSYQLPIVCPTLYSPGALWRWAKTDDRAWTWGTGWRREGGTEGKKLLVGDRRQWTRDLSSIKK